MLHCADEVREENLPNVVFIETSNSTHHSEIELSTDGVYIYKPLPSTLLSGT